MTSTAYAQTASRDLSELSLDELMNIHVTSAQRKEQRADDVAAPVYVVTQDDIRRSGLTELPEILRLVPGVQVAQVNASEWAISVRGFNSLYSDKLLVLIDGRSLYNRGFSGVFWDGQNILASDIERIEVIRGPGGTAWGANAVNGVINIITKSAADTKGTLIDVGAGSHDRQSATVRHGGTVGNTAYRVYSTWADHGTGVTAARTAAVDRWGAVTTGMRADWSGTVDSIMAQASYMAGRSRPNWLDYLHPESTDATSELSEAVAAIKWSHRRSTGALFQVQGFNTVTVRDESTLYQRETTADVDVQYQTPVGARQTFVAGGGYRDSDLSTRQTPALNIGSEEGAVANAFVEDDIAVAHSLHLTLGSKIEWDRFAGVGLLPSAHVMWSVDHNQRVWAAVSRARRTPAAAYRTISLVLATATGENGLPIVAMLYGTPDLPSENLLQVDAGYRLQVGSTASFDVSAFRGAYDHSTTFEALTPRFEFVPAPRLVVGAQYGSLLEVRTAGIEIAGHWSPGWRWRVDGSYSGLRVDPDVDAASTDTLGAARFDGNAPQHQWQLHATSGISRRLQATAGVFYAGPLRETGVPAYTRADGRIEFKLSPQVTASISGQNLLTPSHVEFSDDNLGLVGSRVPRTARVQLRWQF